MKRTLASILTAVFLCCIFFAFAACDDKNADGQISDADWERWLSFDFETEENFTLISETGPLYSKEEAAEYGEWEKFTHTWYIDRESQRIHVTSNAEMYIPADPEEGTEAYFRTTEYDKYVFYYNSAYYSSIYSEEDARYYATLITKASFIEEIESITNITALFSMYSDPLFRSVFEYNKETGRYEMYESGTLSVALEFSENGGVSLYSQTSSIRYGITALKDVDKTTVELSSFVIDSTYDAQS